jgi:hypothetical protein
MLLLPLIFISLTPSHLQTPFHRRPSIPTPPTHHRRPFCPTTHHRWPPIFSFPPFFPQNPKLPNPIFFFQFFYILGHKSILGLCPFVSVLVLYSFCRGLGSIEKGSQTLRFWDAHQVLNKTPQRTSKMPRGRGSSSQSSGTRPIIAKPPIESHKLLLENTFAIKEEFSNNEATSWAVQELKNRGLKRLLKPVASTAYERLVREFYEHLSVDCDQSDILFSSIDGREVEVTKADVTAILKCSHEPPESDVPWLKCPSMLTLEDIVSDICEGQYTDSHWNAASKMKIPQNLLFIDMVLYKNVCPLGHKTQRRDCVSFEQNAFHKGFWCSIPEIIWRQI